MITIHPADGLINRLLQQPNPHSSSSTSPVAAAMPSEVRSGEDEDQAVQQHTSERELESHLLQLYRTNVRTKQRP